MTDVYAVPLQNDQDSNSLTTSHSVNKATDTAGGLAKQATDTAGGLTNTAGNLAGNAVSNVNGKASGAITATRNSQQNDGVDENGDLDGPYGPGKLEGDGNPLKKNYRIVPVKQSRIKDRPVKVGEKDSNIKIKIELDLEVEVEIYARVKGKDLSCFILMYIILTDSDR